VSELSNRASIVRRQEEGEGPVIGAATEVHQTGAAPGLGTFTCARCGSQLSLHSVDRLPECPRCGGSRFQRASMFEHDNPGSASTVEFEAPPRRTTQPEWLDEIREDLPAGARCMATMTDGKIEVFPLELGWTRIGRSATADLRLDDPSVSRRHALIVWEDGEPLRVLDDRSLNGIFINGSLTEWGTLMDGDELVIGRYRLYLAQS
jgi:predicted  nucleic acid-binding Zn-ribbon protein